MEAEVRNYGGYKLWYREVIKLKINNPRINSYRIKLNIRQPNE
jgi:hypothetical protein